MVAGQYGQRALVDEKKFQGDTVYIKWSMRLRTNTEPGIFLCQSWWQGSRKPWQWL